MTKNIIHLNNICCSFANKTVLKNINLEIETGQVVALLGPSGAGKSTLLRHINLLEEGNTGSVQICDFHFNFGDKLRHKDTLSLRQHVSIVFQQFHLWPHKTVLQNIMLAPTVVLKQKPADVQQHALSLLEKVGLADKNNVYPQALSGGQQQRVAIARALAMRPKVILFDEPTASLDPENTQGLARIIKKLAAESKTMIIATHDMAFARQIADRIVFMEAGEIIADECSPSVFNQGKNERINKFISALN
ncbi:MAG: amino acid ABC transporter ATP-binding protein [Pseudomonadota bacterium]